MHLQFGRSCEKGLEHRFSNPRRTPPLAPQEMLLRGILSPPSKNKSFSFSLPL
jgi:hypothetical protein